MSSQNRMVMKKTVRGRIIGKLLFSAWLAVACQAGSSALTVTPEAHFLPPTAGSQGNLAQFQPTPPPTRQANCQNILKFEEDLTIPDGTEVRPGQRITKRWLTKNQGSCNWDQAYSLQLISGLALGAETNQQLYPARQNSQVILEIVFSAPENPGRYNTWWQAYDPDGNRFGDPIYMEIAVLDQD
jgi:hypothetical protein